MSYDAGIKPFQVSRAHSTWARTFGCRPQLYVQPRTLDEIKLAVAEAKRLGKTIMLTGAGHSPSTLTMTNEWLMNLDRFNRVLEVQRGPNGAYTDVTVEAGIRIYELTKALADQGLAIQNLGSISDQSAAGIISTGTHGSSALHGLVSQQIVNLTLLTASGDLVQCSADTNSDLFRASLLSLGKLGIIVHITVRAIPAFRLESKQEILPFDRLLSELWPTIWTSAEFIRVWWFPYSNRCVLWRADKTLEPVSAPRYSFYGTSLGRFFYESLLWLSVKVYPAATPAIERWVFRNQYGFVDTYNHGDVAVQVSNEALNMDCLFSQFVNEWALPLTNGIDVLNKLGDAVAEAQRSGDFYVHAPIEVRISNTSQPKNGEEPYSGLDHRTPAGPVGPVPGNNLRPLLDGTPKLTASLTDGKPDYSNLTLYINATMYRPFGFDCPIDRWYQKFEAIVAEAGGKPHWAKNFLGTNEENKPSQWKDGQMRGIKPTIESWFGSDLLLWKQLRQKYDPSGVFLAGLDWAAINGLT